MGSSWTWGLVPPRSQRLKSFIYKDTNLESYDPLLDEIRHRLFPRLDNSDRIHNFHGHDPNLLRHPPWTFFSISIDLRTAATEGRPTD
jgi:hypothetical protein